MNDVVQPGTGYRWLRILANLVVCLIILGGAAAAIIWINQTEPVAEKINATRKSAALVETLTARRGTYRPRLIVLGTVESAQQISLRPRVNGQVVELSPEFVPGGLVKKGDLLLRIDPADFENALSIRESELKQANALLRIEEARKELAAKELQLLKSSIEEANEGLVMREPQLASIRAQVSAANAAIERAELDLARTKIEAPFDAQILTRSVNIGSQVGTGDELGQLVGLEEYWIMAAVPIRSLRWVQFPQTERPASEAADDGLEGCEPPLDDDDPDPGGAQPGWLARDLAQPGRLGRRDRARGAGLALIGTIDQQSRLARVLVTIKNPLGNEETGTPRLILGTLLETEIVGRPIKDVVRLPRGYVRNQDTVWVMKDDKLEIRPTTIVFRDAQYAYIREGLADGDQVVTSTLATVAPGVGLRKIQPAEDDEREPDSPPEQDAEE